MRREAPEPGGAEAEGSGGSSGGSTVGPGEKTWGSQEEEEGDGRAAVEGPGSSEERNKVVEDWESKVLGSESVREKTRKSHSGMHTHQHLLCANSMPSSMLGTEMNEKVEMYFLPLRACNSVRKSGLHEQLMTREQSGEGVV